MILIIGGAGQGKLDYVLQKTGPEAMKTGFRNSAYPAPR